MPGKLAASASWGMTPKVPFNPIHKLPIELLYNIFEPLDSTNIRSCTLVCQRWRLIAQRLMYRSPRLSSTASLDAFCDVVALNPELANAVHNLHIRGKTNYSSTRPTPWILEVPIRLVHLLPNVRSITFDQIEQVEFCEDFWAGLEGFTRVTSLAVEASRFHYDTDLKNLIFAFPKLRSLTLSNVRWANENPSQARRKYPLPLEALRLNKMPGRDEYATLFRWFGRVHTVKELEVFQYPREFLDLLAAYLHHLADKGGSLHSLRFAPTISLYHGGFVSIFPEIGEALCRHTHLRELRLNIFNMISGPMAWVPRLLQDLHPVPLARIALDFTLDWENASRLIPEWSETNSRLQSQWTSTLQKVTLTHYPVGNFVSDATVRHLLTSRLPHLNERRLLDVFIGERYA